MNIMIETMKFEELSRDEQSIILLIRQFPVLVELFPPHISYSQSQISFVEATSVNNQ